jgi:hypothetical protein
MGKKSKNSVKEEKSMEGKKSKKEVDIGKMIGDKEPEKQVTPPALKKEKKEKKAESAPVPKEEKAEIVVPVNEEKAESALAPEEEKEEIAVPVNEEKAEAVNPGEEASTLPKEASPVIDEEKILKLSEDLFALMKEKGVYNSSDFSKEIGKFLKKIGEISSSEDREKRVQSIFQNMEKIVKLIFKYSDKNEYEKAAFNKIAPVERKSLEDLINFLQPDNLKKFDGYGREAMFNLMYYIMEEIYSQIEIFDLEIRSGYGENRKSHTEFEAFLERNVS